MTIAPKAPIASRAGTPCHRYGIHLKTGEQSQQTYVVERCAFVDWCWSTCKQPSCATLSYGDIIICPRYACKTSTNPGRYVPWFQYVLKTVARGNMVEEYLEQYDKHMELTPYLQFQPDLLKIVQASGIPIGDPYRRSADEIVLASPILADAGPGVAGQVVVAHAAEDAGHPVVAHAAEDAGQAVAHRLKRRRTV